jgi:hypothetical protein
MKNVYPTFGSRGETLLFRWVGRHIDHELGRSSKLPRLRSETRHAYLELLREALDERKGLFAGVPQDDFLGLGKNLRVDRPCLCFTELRLGQGIPFWRNFGRMAFGFSKSTIANCGGGPVAYVSGGAKDKTVRRLEQLHRYFSEGRVKGPEFKRAGDAFRALSHLFKRMRKPVRSAGIARPEELAPTRDLARGGAQSREGDEQRAERLARYPRWKPLPYLEENEWRIVYDQSGYRWSVREGAAGKPSSAWFKIEPGRELVTVVVPDNRTLQMVMESPDITSRLVGKDRPPVQLLSLEAVVLL